MNLELALSAISLSGLVPLIIQIVIAGLVLWLLWWIVGFVGLPQPFAKVAQVILALVAVVWLINILMGIGGNGFIVR